MPEGPEVQRHADALHDALAGRVIREFGSRIKKTRAWLEEHPEAFVGQRVERVTAHGKHLIGYVEGDLFFHSHLMMWGRWHVVEPGDALVLTRDRRERARIVTDEAAAILLSAPVFTVGQGDPYGNPGDATPHLATLGPDVLDEPFDEAAFRARLERPQQARRAIGAVLLDQQVLAGIGNYLRAEILFRCRIDPWTKARDLTPVELGCLIREIPRFSQRAYRHAQTVTPEDRERLVREPDLVYNEAKDWNTRHYVFRRTNLPCLDCGTPIRQAQQTTRQHDDGDKQRVIYFCPSCQPVDLTKHGSKADRKAALAKQQDSA